ncbi:hypothetical protein PMZ80_010970 [Knufia obscura]|uniref:Uncharacterized protein n=1 Tax=Knufia obscura TaxID=1635080 RepID=A0ABR0R883_9EURO|nr:hypothetical protein PMZ80_010970 [Knufia obscura]
MSLKLLSALPATSWSLSQFFVRLAMAASNGSLNLFSGSQCADPNPMRINGTLGGICTQIEASFWSFSINTLDTGCTVTVYDRNNQYCGEGRRVPIFPDQCIGNDTSISQFTVDCPGTDITPTSPAPTPTPEASTSNAVPPSSTKIAVGVAVPVCAIAFISIMVWLLIIRSRRTNAAKQEPAPPYAEVEGKPAYAEADSEAIRQRHKIDGGPKRQSRVIELNGDWAGSELQGTTAANTSDSGERQVDTRADVMMRPEQQEYWY